MIIYILISVAAGVSVVVARTINSNLANRIGTFQGTFFNYVVGLIFSGIFLMISREALGMSAVTLKSIPWWAYLGGATGVVVVGLSNYITPKISAFYLTLLLFLGQLLVGIVIDYFTLGQVSAGKLIGGLLVLGGLTYNLIIDKSQEMQVASEE